MLKTYTSIKNWSRQPKSLNALHKGAYYFCMNCLNGFRTAQVRGKLYEYYSNIQWVRQGHVVFCERKLVTISRRSASV